MASKVNYFKSELTEVKNNKSKKDDKNQENQNNSPKKTNNESRIINILLLGATGVGKSTFINSIVNYLQHENYSEAEKNNLHILIPSAFTVYDKHKQMHTFTVGSTNDKTEFLEVGVSATQCVRTYRFKITGNIEIRLIDTPGMGDTRGIEQDNDNCEQILNYISRLYHLHAICFLFRSQESRSTVYFKYCMAQIMSRLEKSACKNIVFVFTNSSGYEFTPGNTLELLKQEAEEIKKNPAGAELRLDYNTFCIDNKGLSYLLANKRGINLDGNTKHEYIKSWNKSTSECWKIIGYIQKLHPHYVQHTNAINEARRMIYQLSRPMAEITQLINDNINILQRHQVELDENKDNIEKLKKKLYIPVIKLEVTNVTQPVTVCTDLKCIDIYMVDKVKEIDYKTRCHDPCFLNNVPKDIRGSAELMNCCAMNPQQKCKVCGCSYKLHMHVYYMTKKVNGTKKDTEILKGISTKEDVIRKAAKTIIGINIRAEELENERLKLVQYNAKFSYFLQCNAIAPFSDSYAAYIEHLILTEQRLNSDTNEKKLAGLERLLMEHNQLKTLFEQDKLLSGSGCTITPKEISADINQLYNLKHFGRKIKELVVAQDAAMRKEYSVTEYSHKAVFSQFKKKQLTQQQNKNKKSDDNNKSNQEKPKPNQQNKSNQNRRPRSPPPSYDNLTKQSDQNRITRNEDPNYYPRPFEPYWPTGFHPNDPQPFHRSQYPEHPPYPHARDAYNPRYGPPNTPYYPPSTAHNPSHPRESTYTGNETNEAKNVEISVKILKEGSDSPQQHVPNTPRGPNGDYGAYHPDHHPRYGPDDYPPRGDPRFRHYPYGPMGNQPFDYHNYPPHFYPKFDPNYPPRGYPDGPGPRDGYPYGDPSGHPSGAHYQRLDHLRDPHFDYSRNDRQFNPDHAQHNNSRPPFNVAEANSGNNSAPSRGKFQSNDSINRDLAKKMSEVKLEQQRRYPKTMNSNNKNSLSNTGKRNNFKHKPGQSRTFRKNKSDN